DRVFVERLDFVPLGVEPSTHLLPPAARHERRRLAPAQVVQPWVAQPADLERVAEPAGRDQPGGAPRPSRIAFVATVVPWTSSLASPTGRFACSRRAATPSPMARP